MESWLFLLCKTRRSADQHSVNLKLNYQILVFTCNDPNTSQRGARRETLGFGIGEGLESTSGLRIQQGWTKTGGKYSLPLILKPHYLTGTKVELSDDPEALKSVSESGYAGKLARFDSSTKPSKMKRRVHKWQPMLRSGYNGGSKRSRAISGDRYLLRKAIIKRRDPPTSPKRWTLLERPNQQAAVLQVTTKTSA